MSTPSPISGGPSSGNDPVFPAWSEKAVPVPKAQSPFEIWATIKKSSKYYSQGLDENRKPVPFRIEQIVMLALDGYNFIGGPGGRYRREDLQLHVRDGNSLKRI